MVVYPHWRGELEPCQNGASFVPGLSPLPRGTRFAGRYHRAGKRFIPAGAGNSIAFICHQIGDTVYPRWRGELCLMSDWRLATSGLSPLARGTRLTILVRNNQRRFIPAGAGNSRSAAFPHASRSVYPRWRGELDRVERHSNRTNGLSPLARGTPAADWRGKCAGRFIPAGAGNSLNITYY